MEDAERAIQTINDVQYITLATSNKNGLPWNTPLYSVHNKNLIFYWASSPDSRHSSNIKENENVAITIYNSKAEAGEGFGVYIMAKAKVVEDESEIQIAFKLFKKSKFISSLDDLKGDSPLRLYKATPEGFWINGITKVKGRFVDIRKEITLDK